MIRRLVIVFFVFTSLTRCTNNNGPDVSGIPADISIARFDKYLFEDLDTNNIARGIADMQAKYPYFAQDFVSNILGLPAPAGDSISPVTASELKRFIHLTRPLYDSLHKKFEDLEDEEADLEKAFKHVKYYFPDYRLPKVLSYVGPFDAPAVAITQQAIAVGLQLFAGKDFAFYTSDPGQELYPRYISRRFESAFIPASVMNAVIQDMYPDRSQGRPLIEQMIIKGKEWYLLDKFLPDAPDSIKTGYTQSQLNWVKDNEGLVWNFLLQHNDLYTTEPAFIKMYIGESPNTEGMPQQSPGNIGQWVGWQIVKTYADKHPELKPADIMKADARKIFAESKYKPR